MNGYEIRHNLFQQASDILHQHWYVKVEADKRGAKLNSRADSPPAPPTFEEIEDYAKKVYGFVQDKDMGKIEDSDESYFSKKKK